MYIPQAFALDGVDEAFELVGDQAFAHLVSMSGGRLTATSLPLLVDRRARVLRGHLARANPHWRGLDGSEVLVIVPGPDAYVSPSWYPSKAEHGRVVPTWNYQVVHLHGVATTHEDGAWLEKLVRDLTDRHEAGRPSPWSVDDAPAGFVERQLRAIVGVEVAVDRIEAKSKLSQNRPVGDVDGVIAGLEAGGVGDRRLAEAMRE